MFRKLRNKLILINLGITTAVILVTFTTIYIVSTRSADNRPPMPEKITIDYDEYNDLEKIITFSIREEKAAAARNLLITLIISGIAIELAVALLSYYLAEEAIRPVKEAYESQKIFIANASHEIKTPLAAISANLEAADIKNNKWINNVEKEADKLAKLNGELLTLARTDLMTTREVVETDLKELTEETLKSFNPRMKNLILTKKILTTKKIKINREDFAQILSILLDNAVKYADKKIYLSLNDHKLEIKNDGATIKKDALPHIFDRFYQADKTSEGVGLGLSIAKQIASNNHWQLTATSNTLTTFTLSF